jgi:hypothetical protein
MDLQQHWPQVLDVLRSGKKSSKHFAIATVDPSGNPHVTPIGHAFFRDDMTGYYFDAYSRAMPNNFEHNPRICLMAVNSGTWFWLNALRHARFDTAPAVRLFGEVGAQRDATAHERHTLQQSIRLTRGLPGHKLLWGSLTRVRDMTFSSFSPAEYPVMCEGLWQ